MEGKTLIASFIKSVSSIKTILDIGAGNGTYSDLISSYNIRVDKLDAVEVWEPCVYQFNLFNKYDNVFIEDARTFNNFNYDLVIFGDVLEHMSKEEAQSLWDKAASQARFGIISIPTIHYPQGKLLGNPYEVHVKEDWSTSEVLESFPFIVNHKEYSVVSVFFADFRKK